MDIPTSEQLKPIARRYGLDLIVLFGSQVKGTTHPESDVDVAVLPRKALTERRWLNLWCALSQVFPGNVDMTMLNHATPLLRYHVVRDGKLLYEGRRWAWENQKGYAYHAYWDNTRFFDDMHRYVDRKAEEYRRAG